MKFLLLLISLSFFLSVSSQTRFNFKNYSINEGISQSSITTLVQDDLNSMWIGTQDGLNRFDGQKFEIFTTDNTEEIESDYILCSLKDSDGNLYFGTNKGLLVYDFLNDSFHSFFLEGNHSLTKINSISEDENGNIWVAITDIGVYKFDRKEASFVAFSSKIPSFEIKKISISDQNELIIITEKNEVFIYDIQKNTTQKVNINTSKNIIFNSISFFNGKTYLCSNKGVFELNHSFRRIEGVFTEFNQQFGLQNVSDVFYENGFGWILCTKKNGVFFIMEDKGFHHCVEDIFQKNALLFNEINQIVKDNSGTFWLATQRGISSFNPTQQGILGVGVSGKKDKGIPSPSVWSFSETDDAKYLFIGTDNAVTKLNKITGKFQPYFIQKNTEETTKEESSVLSLKVINENTLLVGRADGLLKLNISENNYQFTPLQTVFPKKHQRIYSIIHWKDQLYWAATKEGAILYNDKDKSIQFFEHDVKNAKETISPGICRLVYLDQYGEIWFTTSSGGLNQLISTEKELKIVPYGINKVIKKITSSYITSVFRESEDVFWLGTFGTGLLKLNQTTKKIEVFNKQNGLPNNVVYGVLPGKLHSIWLSTNKGISNFNTQTKTTKNYTEIDGLMSNEFNLGAFMKSSDEFIYFGGIYGFNFFDPNNLSEVNRNINVSFTKLKVDKEWVKPNEENSILKQPFFLTKEILLDYKQRSFTIKFQASDISNPDILNYKYILEGSNDGEILLGSDNEIHFSSISHGEYTLMVYARLGEGEWSKYPAKLKITIEAPFWSTWWFILISILSFAGFIRLYFKKRVDDARKDQLRLEMKINERTREIKKQNKKIEQQRKKLEIERNKVVKQQGELQKEKDKTERLLKNIIPESIADDLKKKGKASARSYDLVSILFTDFVGFSKISTQMKASELVKKLDIYFTKFDKIIIKNNLEKIKTIGDAYMAAGGVPVRNKTNPIDTCIAAIQIQSYMLKRKNDAIANNGDFWELRLGINTGDVTAGVIGSERLAFDIWGSAVNTAQRMEMLGKAGKVTISEATYTLIEPYFECIFLGTALTKNNEEVMMYSVESIKKELSINSEGIEPNDKFHQIVNLHYYSSINYYKAERHIINKLSTELSENLHYHSISHTKDVVTAVERLALSEGVTDEGLFLLKSAASYHDAGFVEKYDKNEKIGARMAEEILPKYGYTVEHIERIKQLIYVTEIPHKPKNKLEEIICDADLDYLGRDDFHKIAGKLCKELMEHGKINNPKQWDEIQVIFLKQHRYFTKTSIETRRKKKEQNLQEVIERLERNEY